MSSNLDTIRTAVDDGIKPNLPADWVTVPNLSAAKNSLSPVLYTEFTGITTEHNGVRIPAGHVICDFDLVIVVPGTDDRKSEDAVDSAVLDLILALDAATTDLVWDKAKKERITTGQLAWRVSLSVITTSRK